jgi:3-hydroxyisobutyrate dehydrogenase-like beta-hydroxyacid dehydrogenase
MTGKIQFRLGLVGYGEIGSTLGQGLRAAGLKSIACYDKYAFDGPYAELIQKRAQDAGVTLVRSNGELADAADLIISVTPGSQSVASATAFSHVLGARHVFVDFASATPNVKTSVAEILSKTSAHVGDASIMGTPRDGYSMTILSSGEAGKQARDLLNPWGMKIEYVSERVGTASGIKILRSVLIKGIEALIDETMLAARHYQLEDAVFASASKTLARPWMETVESLMTSGVIHAQRRMEEVIMASEAVQDAGIDPIMARATVERLKWKAKMGLKEHFGGVVPASAKEAVDGIRAKMGETGDDAKPM